MNDLHEVYAVTDGARSVAYVRAWAARLLEGRGHLDLVDTSTLALSELVTNALLHARGPISVSCYLGSAPWFGVRDASPNPPLPRRPDASLLTVGRGLDLVALCSSAWGARISATGKLVWFRPVPEPDGEPAFMQTLYDATTAQADSPEETVTIRLENTPVADFQAMIHRHRELQREFNLLTLSQDTHPDVRRVLATYPRAHGVLGGLAPIARVPAYVSAGGEGITTFEFQFFATHPSLIDDLVSLLAAADELSLTGKLLWRGRTPEEVEYDLWVAEQFMRQSVGSQHGGRTR